MINPSQSSITDNMLIHTVNAISQNTTCSWINIPNNQSHLRDTFTGTVCFRVATRVIMGRFRFRVRDRSMILDINVLIQEHDLAKSRRPISMYNITIYSKMLKTNSKMTTGLTVLKLPTISVNFKDVTFSSLVHIALMGNENELFSVTFRVT